MLTNRIFRFLIVILFGFLMYSFFYKKLNWSSITEVFAESVQGQSIIYLGLAIALMPINWLLESIKWQLSILPTHKISLLKSLQAILYGISLGILTPGRIGEYGGRVLALPNKHIILGAWGTLTCSINQNIINIGMGLLVGFFYFGFESFGESQKYSLFIISCLVLLIMVIVLLCRTWILRKFESIAWFTNRVEPKYHVFLKEIKTQTIGKIFLISMIRYIVYLSQFVLLLMAMRVNLSVELMYMGVAIIFFLQTIIPLTPILQLGLRGGLAIFVFAPFTMQEEALTVASYCMWIVNLFVPALIGMILLYRLNFYARNSKTDMST